MYPANLFPIFLLVALQQQDGVSSGSVPSPAGLPSTTAQKLTAFPNIDINSLSVSGISSGGIMAAQYSFIYSNQVKATGIFAGGPYLCGYGLLGVTSVICMETPELLNVTTFEAQAAKFEASKLIDPTSNLNKSNVYIFHGILDPVVRQPAGKKVAKMYSDYGANVKGEFSIASGHGQPVDRNGYGGLCALTNPLTTFVNECGYDGAYEMFKWLYGSTIVKPQIGYVAPYSTQLQSFDQSEFLTNPLLAFMSSEGMIYIPTGCQDKANNSCRLHIAFHGCAVNQILIGNGYAVKTHYLEVAEQNNIIVLFPQTGATAPGACWDWYGYSGTSYPTNKGVQTSAVYKMMQRVLGTA